VLPVVSHRAAVQTRRRLRAGHRAEPVALQVPLPSSPRALPCLAMVSNPCSDERSPSSGSLSAPTRLHHRRSSRTRTYTRGAEPLSSLVLSRGPKFYLFWAETHGQHTHRREPGMPVPPACLCRSGPFSLRRRARPRTSPLGRKHACARLSLRMVLWPCPRHVGCDPVALVRTVLSLPLPSPSWTSVPPRRVSPELVVAEPGSRPRATPFFTQTKP
jgi:hypothetical protein